MPQEFRYPLTRYCLRGGALTLPRAMVGVFPDSGEVTALDTKSETEYQLTVVDERTVLGLGPLFKRHRLAVNDELVIRALDDGRYAITPVAREHKPDYSNVEEQTHLLDELIAASVPVTEAEVRALYEHIPAELDLGALLASDERFVMREGRWHNALSLAYPLEPAPAAAEQRLPTAEHETSESQRESEMVAVGGAESAPSEAAQASAAEPLAGDGLQSGLWVPASTEDTSTPPPPAPSAPTVFERRRPDADSEHQVSAGELSSAAAEEDDDEEDDGAGLEINELSSRLRAVLAPCGFRLEPVAKAQILLTADLGRKSYTVLVQLLTRNDRLDWADLLARRRALNVRYLAVVGDHRALLRLINPAELARATMWSWQSLDRLRTLQRTMSFSPIELESHFERDGLFEKGLERFEASVATRVAERGLVSELLTRLAQLRAPTVFLLEDLANDLKVPRDRLLKLLEMLSEAPFHLVSKVDHGEFVLRQRVADSLSNMAIYATSLRERLPARRVERLTATAEPDLLTGGELDGHALTGNDEADQSVAEQAHSDQDDLEVGLDLGGSTPNGRALDA